MLALRGWGEREFRLVTGEFLAAVRFGLFAETIAPELAQAEAAMKTPLTRDLSATERAQVTRLRLAAEQQRSAIRAALFPEDD